SVQAFSSNATRGFKVEDTASINLRFANGALGSFLLSDTAASPRSWEQTSQENKAYATYPEEDAYVVIGANGSLAVPAMRRNYYERPGERSARGPLAAQQVLGAPGGPVVVQAISGEDHPARTGRSARVADRTLC